MKQNLSLSLLIENWKKFLNGEQINEISLGGDKHLQNFKSNISKQHAQEFVNSLVTSEKSGLLLLSMLENTLKDYKNVINKSHDSEEYIRLVNNVFGNSTTILDDDEINKMCINLEILIQEVKEKLGIKEQYGTI